MTHRQDSSRQASGIRKSWSKSGFISLSKRVPLLKSNGKTNSEVDLNIDLNSRFSQQDGQSTHRDDLQARFGTIRESQPVLAQKTLLTHESNYNHSVCCEARMPTIGDDEVIQNPVVEI